MAHRSLTALLGLFALATLVAAAFSKAPPVMNRDALQREMKNGNFRDAYDGFRRHCLEAKTDPRLITDDLSRAVQCLAQLGRITEMDELVEATIATHQQNWRLLAEAARQYLNAQHDGFLVAGKFERGPHRGGGSWVQAQDRDRARALQLMVAAMPLVREDDNKADVGQFYLTLADVLLGGRGFDEAWRLQTLTDLSTLPDYDEGHSYWRPLFQGAAVDAEGKPVFHAVAERWETAASDGQRWRWALREAVENLASLQANVLEQMAQFSQQQFGVETLAHVEGGWRGTPPEDEKNESGTYALHTLADDETIAKLAIGVRRFRLPDEYNPIKLHGQLAEMPAQRPQALEALATIYQNRRQYPQAAENLRQLLELQPNNPANRQALQQIVGNWGTFEPAASRPKGTGASVEFRYRNGKKVELEAHVINVDQLLADAKAHLKSNPQQLDGTKLNLEDIGYRLVQGNEKRYVGARAAAWTVELEPRPNHFDRRVTITTPVQTPGAYLVTAKMTGGNTSKIVLWISDAAIARKMLAEKTLYYVADSVSGQPLAGANIEFFGYRQEHVGGNRFRTITTNFAEVTDANGQVTPSARELKPEFAWLVIARKGKQTVGHLGFNGVWFSPYHDQAYKEVKFFGITDRPVYRPKQTAHFKFWAGVAQYDLPDSESPFTGQSFSVTIVNPKGEKVLEKPLTADRWGGIEGELELPVDATLGVYSIQVAQTTEPIYTGLASFRVEEYKKPEFEVTIDAPSEPVALGETIRAEIKAKYYFGSPVSRGTVKYKITRAEHTDTWYPIMPWDWCYGRGYWWFAYDYAWYPGWGKWVGCVRPVPWWWHGQRNPPELIAEVEVPLGEDGVIPVEIDTTLAKELHGDLDHAYTITAEVRDESRRTIVGQGQVLVARQPFKVFSWTHRGYYRVGDAIEADFMAQTLDAKPVAGRGKLSLLKIRYGGDREPLETPAQEWELDTDETGRARQQFQASAPGQYRLSYTVTDKAGHSIEGGYLFTVVGDGFDGRDFRFNQLELIPDKREYQPGEKVRLQLNTDRVGSTVLLFVRPSNGVCLPPQTIRLEGKSTIREIDVVQKDMPNFFIEALTIADGKVYSETREIVVPPEKRVLNVAIEPSATEYRPGEKATMKIHLTDHAGENYVGSTVVAIYDKSVEYISGGSNVGDIKEFFWKWRRQHQPHTEHNLSRYSSNQTLPNQPGMSDLGIFGHSVADEIDELGSVRLSKSRLMIRGMRGAPGGGGFGGGGGGAEGGLPAPAMAAEARAEGENMGLLADAGGPGGEAGGAGLVQPSVRSNFADTALWVGSLTTDAHGLADVSLTMPENLSTWKVKVWGIGNGTRVGSADLDVITRKNLIVRLQAPRFFVQKDEVVLSANVHNYLPREKQVTVQLELEGTRATTSGASPLVTSERLSREVRIPAGGEQRVDWRVRVLDEGTAVVRMKALTDEESDAMEMSFPCHVHGLLKTESWAGTVRPEEDSASVTVVVPDDRRPEQSVLEIRYSPTLAGAMVDALPYLVDYPYGCTEQTLNRFLPAVITQKTLIDMNLDLAAIQLKRANLNAQEIGDDAKRAAQWQRFGRNPVFDSAELNQIVKEGVTRLTDMQNRDGGWGWFSGSAEFSWPHTTCVVVHGLQIAQRNDVPLVPGVVERGVTWLRRHQDQELRKLQNAATKTDPWKTHADALDAFVYMVLVDAGSDDPEMRQRLYEDRNELPVYAKAIFALAAHKQGDAEKVAMLTRNIEQFLVEDQENETAYLKLPENSPWWYWWGSEIEANAYYLKLLSALPDRSPKAPRLVKYLLNNRKHATYWHSTRDTALCVEAFADYLRSSGELKPEMVVEVWVDGAKAQEVEISSANLFSFQNRFVLAGEQLASGSHEVELRRRGRGSVYFNAYLTNFTLEEQITRAGLEIKVQRQYYKLRPVEKKIAAETRRGAAAEQRVEKYERVPLKNLATLRSGDLVEIELEIESKNDYEYILFEDSKPAGFEAVDQRSGYAGRGLGAYIEYRDDRVAFFLQRLARGNHSISYRMRAETPGKFSALPTRGYAMYAPELRANSDEIKLGVEDE